MGQPRIRHTGPEGSHNTGQPCNYFGSVMREKAGAAREHRRSLNRENRERAQPRTHTHHDGNI